ncbi:MAG: histidine phosphatase family protein, partial [Anaerolineae bacterium]
SRREDIARGGGETFVEVQARVLAALRDLLVEHAGQTIAVITHGGPIYACLAAVLNHSFPEVYELLPANRNASVTILRFEDGTIEPLVIMDSSHLEALDAELAAGNAELPDPKAPREA